MTATDRQFGAVTVLVGEENGKYPHGNSLWIRGREATAIIDPSLTVATRADELRGRADLVIQSHVHEDHVAGVHLFPKAKVYTHREDAPGLHSLDGLMEIYGYGNDDTKMRQLVLEQFHFVARPATHSFAEPPFPGFATVTDAMIVCGSFGGVPAIIVPSLS